MTRAKVEATVRHFEGLVLETARQISESGVELECDDIRQLLRIKVWHAVQAFDERRAANGKYLSHEKDRHGRSQLERFVFMCLTNGRKDIEKRPRRYLASLDALRGNDEGQHYDRSDRFDAHYLSVDAELVYSEVEEPELELPETLTGIERQVVWLRLDGRLLLEIDRELGISRAERERLLSSIREKLAHYNPARPTPVHPLPAAAPLDRIAA